MCLEIGLTAFGAGVCYWSLTQSGRPRDRYVTVTHCTPHQFRNFNDVTHVTHSFSAISSTCEISCFISWFKFVPARGISSVMCPFMTIHLSPGVCVCGITVISLFLSAYVLLCSDIQRNTMH